jgi:hypothetical protein
MKVGTSQRIEVILHLPGASVPVSAAKRDQGYTITPVKTARGSAIYVVSAPGLDTEVTLYVQAPAFQLDSNTLKPTVDEDEVRWAFVIAANADHIGEQRIGLRIDQSIPGVSIQPEYRSQDLDDVVVTVEAVGGTAVSTSGFASLAVWVLPAIVIPLIPVTVALIGRENIIAWYRRRFRRNRRNDDDEVIP